MLSSRKPLKGEAKLRLPHLKYVAGVVFAGPPANGL